MKYIRLDTDDKDARWINLAQVSRVTVSSEGPKGSPIVAIFFADGMVKLEIKGTSETNRRAIDHLRAELDELVEA